MYGKKVTRLTYGGLIEVLKSADDNCCEKSAEAIVDESYELQEVNKHRGLTIH
jgi:hypothetical protein